MENIVFDYTNKFDTEDRTGPLVVAKHSKLWLNECTLMLRSDGIIVEDNAYLNVNNCRFYRAKTAIQISANAEKVVIKDSVFGEGTNACIQINESPEAYQGARPMCVELECDGNIFQNNKGYPISEKGGAEYIAKRELYKLEDNTLRGENGKKVYQSD